MKSRLLILLFAFVCVFIMFNEEAWSGNIYYYDSMGYYMYLPTLFIYHDLDELKVQSGEEQKSVVTGSNVSLWDGAKRGWKKNKFPVGVALFQLPFFLVAHAWACNVPGYIPDGYSAPYQVAGILSGIFWVLAGLFYLRRLLKYYFEDNIVAIVLACIAFGTNLYCYTAFDHGMSHPYLFFLFCAILFYTRQLYALKRPRDLFILGFLAGFVVITRSIDIVFVFLLISLWEVSNIQTLKERCSFFYSRRGGLILAFIGFFLVAFIQMSFWKYRYGNWIYDSYQGEGFNFLNPHIMQGLFSYQKGWFVYTPVALAGIIGLISFWKYNRKLAPSIIIYFAVTIYIVFSWKCWWYGGSFGTRPMIESLGVLAIPLGYLIKQVFSFKKAIYSGILLAIFSGCIALNLFQTFQYTRQILYSDRMSKAYYWKIFGKTELPGKDYEQYLLDTKYLETE